MDLSLMSTRLLAAAVAEAEQQHLAIAVCVVDTGGHLVAHHRMAGVSYIANDVVRRKAQTACNFRLPTHVFYNVLQQQPELLFAASSQPDVLAVAGGLPILLNGVCVGGLGVGGGTFEQDKAIAERAMQVLTA